MVQEGKDVKFSKGFYSDEFGQYPLVFEKDSFHKRGDKNIYKIYLFGDKGSLYANKWEGHFVSGQIKLEQLKNSNQVVYIALDSVEEFEFLSMQQKLWIQQKDNIMWLVNITVAILAIIATLK